MRGMYLMGKRVEGNKGLCLFLVWAAVLVGGNDDGVARTTIMIVIFFSRTIFFLVGLVLVIYCIDLSCFPWLESKPTE
ncbi:hypothetical protein V8F06_000862 [Rhypophila decipiens]